MRLFLSSIGTGLDGPLLDLVKPGAGVAVVQNALDYIPALERAAYRKTVHDVIAEFREAGFDPFDLDLRLVSDADHDEWEHLLIRCELVFATGGNAFLLQRAMHASGLDRALRRMVAEDRIVYGGWSAGAVVAGPTLRGIDLMDDPMVVPPGYDPAIRWDGLGLVDYSIVPHYRSNHPEAAAADRAAAWLSEKTYPFRTLRDGEAVIVNER